MPAFRIRRSAFTLIEILMVVGIISLLVSVVVVAVNPVQQFKKSNDSKRRSDLTALIDAVYQYSSNHKGNFPVGISTSVQLVDKTAADICADLVPQYIAALPSDPRTNDGKSVSNCSSAYSTGYTIVKTSNNRITVAAPAAEVDTDITLTQ
jgi:prepilin-type N-terminal cleavage/methylation domain-containing protein